MSRPVLAPVEEPEAPIHCHAAMGHGPQGVYEWSGYGGNDDHCGDEAEVVGVLGGKVFVLEMARVWMISEEG